MAQVRIDDEVFEAALRRATSAGYANVDEYITDIVVHDLDEAGDDVSLIFTPERIAELERISSEIKAGGRTYSMAEAHEHFENRRKEWLANHGS